MYESPPQHSSKYSSLPIGWFVVFSLVLHVLLFWGVINNDQKNVMPAAQQAASGLQIRLMPHRVAQNTGEMSRKKLLAKKNVGDVAEKPAATDKQQTSIPQASNSAFRERVLSKLRQSISAHFVYPPLARQRNWQGEVLLTFQLQRNGQISNARIARSSGYGLLDHAALNALTQVGRLGEILPHSLDLELPVIYRLEG